MSNSMKVNLIVEVREAQLDRGREGGLPDRALVYLRLDNDSIPLNPRSSHVDTTSRTYAHENI